VVPLRVYEKTLIIFIKAREVVKAPEEIGIGVQLTKQGALPRLLWAD
jgi:hypothetical protein